MEIKNRKLVGTQGWQQIHFNKKIILDDYDAAKLRTNTNKVKTKHGRVAEAIIRQWFESFLPIRYGVTSGYIVSQHSDFIGKEILPHYDVIIYDKLNSPILWSENNPDESKQGVSRAIPAEYILGVFEIKSNLTPRTVKDAMKKLNDLIPYQKNNADKEDNYYGKFPDNFFCSIIFFELCQKYFSKKIILNNLIPNEKLSSYFGSLVLRFEGDKKNLSGRINVGISKTDMKEIASKSFSLIKNMTLSDSKKIKDQCYIDSIITWYPMNFSDFMFDILFKLQGKFRRGYLSSFYGAVWHERNNK